MSEAVGLSLVMPYNIVVGEFRRTSDDALRSLSRYMALTLGDEWEVRLWDQEGTYRTPFARVAEAGDMILDGGPFHYDVTQPFTVHCYPDYPDGGTTEQSRMIANETIEKLTHGLRVGVGAGHPERIPFYNYNGVPLDGTGSDARGEHDYLRVVRGSLSVGRIPDPTDDRWITVVVNMRLTWRRAGRRIEGNSVESQRTTISAV